MRRTLLAVALLLSTFSTSAAITGRIVDEAGKPVGGARVRVRALETQEDFYARLLSKEPEPPVLATTESGQDGAFRIDTKGHAVVDLILDAPGRQFVAAMVVDGEDAGTYVLRAVTKHVGRVTANGRGVPSALVVLGRSHVTRTDAEGNYEALDPADGNDRLAVIHPEYAIVERPIRARPDAAMIFDVALDAGKIVRARVVDAASRPVAGAVIRANGWPLARSGEDGSFEIARAPEDARGLYAREGKRVGSMAFDRAKSPLVIRLQAGGTIAGSVKSSKDEAPVAGARITVSREGAMWFPRAISDAKGNFAFEAIEPGEHRVMVTHPAFQSQGIPSVRLDEGSRTVRTVFATPLARLIGKVTDDENRPVSGAQVRVSGAGGTTTTAPDGTFTLRTAFLETPRFLWITKPSYAVTNHGPIAVPAGETRSGINIRLTRGIELVIVLVDRDGAPNANEPVVLRRRADPETQRFRSPVPCGTMETAQCLTGADGKLTLNITEGPYHITVGGTTTVQRELFDQTLTARSSPMTLELERGAVVEGRIVWSDGTPASIRGTVQTTSAPIASAPVHDGAFVLRNVPPGKVSLIFEGAPPSSVRGAPAEIFAPASGITLKVPRLGSVEGRVVDRDTEKPVTEYSVVLHRLPRGPRAMRPATSIRDDDGRFVVDDVAPGDYHVLVYARGYASTDPTAVVVEEGKTASASVALRRGGTIAGRVTSAGRPIADARVLVPFVSRAERTDANGEFTADGVPTGSHRIEARRDGYAPGITTVNVVAGTEARAEIELQPGRELHGRVVDNAGRPVAFANVSARAASGTGAPHNDVPTDSTGMFRLSGLAGETYRIVARKEGYMMGTADVNVATASEVTVTLERGGTITGRVIGIPAADLPYVDISASGPRPIMSRAQPDANGAFTLTGVPDGEIHVYANRTRPRRDTARATVTVANGAAPPVEIDFTAGIVVRGRVTLRGRAFAEGSVHFMPIAMPRPHTAWGEIGADSRYEVRLPAAGEYEVTVQRTGRGALSGGRIHVTGEMIHDVDVVGTSMTGRVVDGATRQPVAGAFVGTERGNATTDANGRFTFDLIPDGNYTLRVQAEGYAPESRAVSIRSPVVPEVEIAMSRGIPVPIQIIDGTTGQPTRASIMITDPVSKRPVLHREFIPGSDGMMRVALNPGSYEMSAMVRGATDMAMKRVTFSVPGPLVQVTVERRK